MTFFTIITIVTQSLKGEGIYSQHKFPEISINLLYVHLLKIVFQNSLR